MLLDYNVPDMDKPMSQLTPQDIENATDMQATMNNMMQPMKNAEMPAPSTMKSGGESLNGE